MNVFLGTAAFSGASSRRNVWAASFVGQATFNGCIAFSNWPQQDVEKLLPPELELASNTSPMPHLHPVVFIFGKQTEGAALFGGLTIPMGIAYHEFCMAIPFVKHRRGPYLHTYIPRMYSSYFPATWNGNAHYGFSKAMAKMSWRGRMFMVTTEDDAHLVHARVATEGNWSSGLRCALPNFQAMREVFALPIVGRKADGTYVCSYFGWDFSEARVRSADSCVSIDTPLVEGLTPRRCYDVASGTFEVQGMLWKLSWPSSCQFR